MTPERAHKLYEVAHKRQFNLGVLMENVHDPHNIGAILRSCDAVGVHEVYVLSTELAKVPTRLVLDEASSMGARRWLDIYYFTDLKACMDTIREKYERVLATHMDAAAESLFDLDLCSSVVLAFGNEHDGISEELLSQVDGNFLIPMQGMTQSLNVSVACAVALFEAQRQRLSGGYYQNNPTASPARLKALNETFIEIHEGRLKKRTFRASNRVDS